VCEPSTTRSSPPARRSSFAASAHFDEIADLALHHHAADPLRGSRGARGVADLHADSTAAGHLDQAIGFRQALRERFSTSTCAPISAAAVIISMR